MKRRALLSMIAAAPVLGACSAWPRNPNRATNEGIIVRPEPVAQANLMELIPSGDSVFVSGEMNTDSADGLAAVIEANPEIKRVVFVDATGETGGPGGIRMGRVIRNAGLRTHLRNDSRVSGGAVDAFLGGTQRTLEDGAMVGALKGQAGNDMHLIYVEEMTGGAGYARYAYQFGGRRRPRPMTIAEIGAMAVISRPEDSVLAAN